MERADKACEVLVDGQWVSGDLRYWRQRDGRWEGYVHYTTAIGAVYVKWVGAERLRAVD